MIQQFNIKQLIRQNLLLSNKLAEYKAQIEANRGMQEKIFEHIFDVLMKIRDQLNNLKLKDTQVQSWIASLNKVMSKDTEGMKQFFKIIQETYAKQADLAQKCSQLLIQRTCIKEKFQKAWKNQQIEKYKIQLAILVKDNKIMKQRLTSLNDYDQNAIEKVIEGEHLCYCGGVKLNILKKLQEQRRQSLNKLRYEQHIEPVTQMQQQKNEQPQKSDKNNEAYNTILNKLIHCQQKIQTIKENNKFTFETVLNSQPFKILKGQYKALMLYNSKLITKLKEYYKNLEQIQQQRDKQIYQLSKHKISLDGLDLSKQKILENTEIGQQLRKIHEIIEQYIKKQNDKRLNQGIQGSNEQQKIQYMKFINYLYHFFEKKQHFQFFEENNISYKSIQQKMTNLRKHYDLLVKNVKYLRYKLKSADNEIFRINSSKNGANKSQIQDKKQKNDDLQKINQIKCLATQIENKMANIQFKHTERRALDYLNNSKQQRIRKAFEIQHQNWDQTIFFVRQTVENKTNWLKLLDERQIDYNNQVGKHLGTIEQLKSYIQMLNEKNKYLEGELSKAVAERTQLRIERDARYSSGNNKEINQLRLEVQLQRRKTLCRCHRNNVANIVLSKCRHIICLNCFQQCLNSRKRWCPFCSSKFTQITPQQIKFN